jgi:hypothetical protein
MQTNKKGLAMLNQTMFGIFLVIFVFLMFFTVLKLRTDVKVEEASFEQYEEANKFFLTFLSNPNCLSVGNEINKVRFTTIQGVLDTNKLDKYDMDNEDLWCVENFNLLYTIETLDMTNSKYWTVGILEKHPFWAERIVRASLPGITRYPDGTAHLAEVSINAYFGAIPYLVGSIKRACLLKRGETLDLNIRHDVKYLAVNNSLHIDTDYFFPYFSCKVDDFVIPEGDQLIYVNYMDGKVSVLA